ncbi:MAG: DUF1080 domain-containing protein, partial [Flavisolibacter sp.]
MNKLIVFFTLTFLSCSSSKPNKTADGWTSLFDGKSLTGWRASENPSTFTADSGMIIVHGPRAHLFYEGTVM